MHQRCTGQFPTHPFADDDAADGTDAIVAAALAEFADRGFAAVMLEDIARRAGLETPVLLRAFASKEQLFREVVRSTLVAAVRTLGVAGLAEQDAPAADAMRAFARRYWAAMERPELTALLRLTIAELPRFPELAVFHATETLERYLHELERIIARGVARGELHAIDVRAAARTVLATLAAHALWFAYPEVYVGLVGTDRERAATATIETLIRTLAPVE